MKKTLLLLCTFLCSLGMWATEVSYVMKSYDSTNKVYTATDDQNGVWSLSTSCSTSNQLPADFSQTGASSRGICFSTPSNVTVTSQTSFTNVTKIVVEASSNIGSGTGTLEIKVGTTSLGSKDLSKTNHATYEFTSATALSGVITLTVNQGKNSVWIGGFKVTTNTGDSDSQPTALSVPSNLSSSNVTTTGATLSWDAVSNASSYTVKIGETEYTGVETNSYSAKDLTAGTQYTWTVKAVGDGTNYATSAYAANATFTTETEQGGEDNPSGDGTWTKCSISDLTTSDIFVIVDANTGKAMTNNNGTSSAPAATAVTVSQDGNTITGVTDVMKWNISGNGTNGYTIYPNGSTTTWLYATATNNGVRVGTSDNKTFVIENHTNGEPFLKHSSTERYIGVYNSADWRCYTSINTNINATQTRFYKYVNGDEPTDPDKTVTSIDVTGTPATFWKGDTFNHNGITITANYDDKTTGNVTSSAEFSTPDMTTPGTKTVTVTYQGKTATYDITVQTIANTQETAYTVAQAKTIIDAGKDLTTQVYVAGKISQIDSYDNTYNSITYWISADGTTTDQFEVYSGKNLNNTDFAAQSDIVLGADVVIYGVIKKYKSTYEFDKNNYLVSYTAPVNKTKPELSFAKPSVTAYLDALDEFEGLTVVTNPVGLAGVQYSTSDDTKATVDANTGVVTINNEATPGTVTITASYAETEDYAAADDASYVINIVANKPVVVKRAIVAQMGDKYYAATTDVSSSKLVAVEVTVVDDKVVYTGTADITWNWEATAGTLMTGDKALTQSGTGTNVALTNTGNKTWQIDATLGIVNTNTPTRALVCNGSVFGNYSKDNVGKTGYTGKASLMEISDVPIFASLADLIAADQSFDAVNVKIDDKVFAAVAPREGAYAVLLTNSQVTLASSGEDLGWLAGGTVTGTLTNVAWDNEHKALMNQEPFWSSLTYKAPEVKVFASIDELLDAKLDHGTTVTVTVNGTITEVREVEGDGAYVVVLDNTFSIGSPSSELNWKVGGTVSGTLENVIFGTDEDETGVVSASENLFEKLTYVAPAATITVNSCGNASFSCDKALDFTNADVKAYMVTAETAENITLTEIKKVPANTGIFVLGEGGTYNIPILEGDADNASANKLTATTTAKPIDGSENIWALSKTDGKLHPVNSGTIAAGKAYLVSEFLVANGTNEARGFVFVDDNIITGINAVSGTTANGTTYNLAGQRVEANVKGIVIMNGKKYINK